jgi:hypothetical protein
MAPTVIASGPYLADLLPACGIWVILPALAIAGLVMLWRMIWSK